MPRAGAPGASAAETYELVGVDRRGTLLWLLAAFAALVVVLTRWRGLLALLGFAVSIGLVTKFIVPAILAGSPARLVSLVGSLAVTFVTVGLTYGISPQSLAASLGIALSLGFAALVGTLAVDSAALDGRSGELSSVLSQTNAAVSLQGIVLAGLVIGALGVLADMGVTRPRRSWRCAAPTRSSPPSRFTAAPSRSAATISSPRPTRSLAPTSARACRCCSSCAPPASRSPTRSDPRRRRARHRRARRRHGAARSVLLTTTLAAALVQRPGADPPRRHARRD